jgi:16S rRNA (guanine527-N7)-methyltransferase
MTGEGEGTGQDDRRRALALLSVSRETEDRLQHHVDLLIRWQKIKNLVGPSTLKEVWTRHIADSAQLLDFCPPDAEVILDLGSGAGFPGLVLAALLKGQRPTSVHCVEANHRKAAFLREVIRASDLPAVVHNCRIEDAHLHVPDRIDVITARALAPLPILLEMFENLAKNQCIGLFPKGQDVHQELTQAAQYWMMDHQIEPSRIDPASKVVILTSLHRRH